MKLVVSCFVLTFYFSIVSGTEECNGRSLNTILDVIKNGDWEDLANQLNLANKVTAIKVGCANAAIAKASCYLRELVKEFVYFQPHESCDKTVEKIAQGLDELGRAKEASQLREKFGLESKISSESSTVEPGSRLTQPVSENTPSASHSGLSDWIWKIMPQLSYWTWMIMPPAAIICFLLFWLCNKRNMVNDVPPPNHGERILNNDEADFDVPHGRPQRTYIITALLLGGFAVLVTIYLPTDNAEPPKTTAPAPPKFRLSEKRGLAILVSIDYKDYSNALPLEGTNADAEEMEMTFKHLGYDIHKLQNKDASEDAINSLVQQAAQYLKGYKGKTTDKVIMFAFSGHGSSSDTLITSDGIALSLWREIIKPLVSNSDIRIPKFFLIDACRGNEELTAKDASNQHKSLSDQVKGVLKEEANFRIEYATIPNHQSYLLRFQKESAWMPVLARKLREDNDSFQNIAAKVHKKVQELLAQECEVQQCAVQQCESIDRLNVGPIYLKKEGLGLTVE